MLQIVRGLMCCSSTLAVYEEKKANPSFLCYCGDVQGDMDLGEIKR